MTNSTTGITIIDYPGALQSALHGLKEMLLFSNDIGRQSGDWPLFTVDVMHSDDIENSPSLIEQEEQNSRQKNSGPKVIIIPPNIGSDYYGKPAPILSEWLRFHHGQGAIICSVCAGAFILAKTGLLNNRPATTHWALADKFEVDYPDVALDIPKILINDGDIITAAGLMSWVDLGLEIVAQFMHPTVMRQLGKNMIVDTGLREQRYYQSFSPKFDHGDQAILKVQHYVQQYFHTSLTMTDLSRMSVLTGRTFLRRFIKATGHKPRHYIQRLRIQKACNLIESSSESFETISLKVGYEDASAFRKVFLKIIGLSPREFKRRFSAQGME